METKTDRDQQFEEKVTELLDALYGAALRLAKNRDDAEELLAETVSKAWANRFRLKGQDQFRAWIFRILTKTFLSECRKKNPNTDAVSIDEGCSEEDASFHALKNCMCRFFPLKKGETKARGEKRNACINRYK